MIRLSPEAEPEILATTVVWTVLEMPMWTRSRASALT
jgi:hypothetical protein